MKKTLFLWLFDPVGTHFCVLTVSLIFFPPFIHRWLSRSSIKPNWIREACKRWANNAYCFYRIPLTLIYFLIQPFCFGLAFRRVPRETNWFVLKVHWPCNFRPHDKMNAILYHLFTPSSQIRKKKNRKEMRSRRSREKPLQKINFSFAIPYKFFSLFSKPLSNFVSNLVFLSSFFSCSEKCELWRYWTTRISVNFIIWMLSFTLVLS